MDEETKAARAAAGKLTCDLLNGLLPHAAALPHDLRAAVWSTLLAAAILELTECLDVDTVALRRWIDAQLAEHERPPPGGRLQ